jgi:hypothetical protein
MPEDQKIDQTASGDDKAERSHSDTDPKPVQVYRPRRWLAFAVTVGLVGAAASGFGWLIWASRAFENISDGVKFVTEGSIAFALLLVAFVQACVYWSQRRVMSAQWDAMERSLERTDRVIDKMQSQLEAVRRQEVHMARQSEIMFRSLSETHELVVQNGRAVEAAEKTAHLAEQSSYASERPHFGIIKMALSRPLRAGDRPFVDISWMNGGKTPAWHFYAIVGLSLNENSPDFDPDAEIWTLRHPIGDLSKSFFPEGEQKAIRYQATHKWTQTHIDAIVAGTKRLFIRGKAHWRDTRGESQDWTFRVVYFPATEEFGDYDT